MREAWEIPLKDLLARIAPVRWQLLGKSTFEFSSIRTVPLERLPKTRPDLHENSCRT